jgi:hypothetical protein
MEAAINECFSGTFHDEELKEKISRMPEDLLSDPDVLKQGETLALDSVHTAHYILKGTVDRHIQTLEQKSTLIKSDLIDSLELFESHYNKASKSKTKAAQDIWDQYYQERTEMLWSKEEYVEFSHAHSKMKARVLELQEEFRIM